MKLFIKENNPFITRTQYKKILLLTVILTLITYIIGVVCSLLGSNKFITHLTNENLDAIYNWLMQYKLYPILSWVFTTIEFYIILLFILNKPPKIYYILPFYIIPIIIEYTLNLPTFIYQLLPFLFYLIIPIIDLLISKNKLTLNNLCKYYIRLLIAIAVVFTYQLLIYIMKSSMIAIAHVNIPLALLFVYLLEYYLALLITLQYIALLLNKEKGGVKECTNYHHVGSSSQTSQKSSLRLSLKQMPKKQRNKLILLYIKVYFIQTFGFLLLMILPILLGKVSEFLLLYVSFASTRYILGFNYSLHFKKETVCISVGAIIFGLLTLFIPFFSENILFSILPGVGLAILLHLSYKYKGMYLFMSVANNDRYATLYVYFNANTDKNYILMMGNHYGLDKFEIEFLTDYLNHYKLSYLSKKYNYSLRSVNNKLDEIIYKIDSYL